MSMIMNHDMTAIMGQRIMQRNSLAMKRSLEKLSSGLRTKIADVDNTAGLAISETMRSRIGGMEKALNNSQDGISLIQTANGALDQTQSMLMRMRELTVQAANDTLTQQDRGYIQVEINEIRDEISNLATNTQFNRKNILSGDSAVLWSSTSDKVKAIVNGGMRSIDSYGQKYSLDGNYRLQVKAEAGKAQVQKTDIFKIKHDGSAWNKTLNKDAGVSDVAVSNVPAGQYTIALAEDAEPATEGVLTGSYGLGGTRYSTDTEFAFADEIGSPVTKVTVSTTDGVEIWSRTGSDIFGNRQNGGVTTAADQSAFFEGRTDTANGPQFVGVKDEIISAAAEKGITISGFDEVDAESGAITLTAQTFNSSAPGLIISYETEAPGVAPTGTVTQGDTEVIAASDVFTVEVSDANLENASVLFEVKSIDADTNTVTLKAVANKLSQDGVTSYATQDNISKIFGGTEDSPAVTNTLGENGVTPIQKGAKFVYSIKAGAEDAGNENPIELDISHIPDHSSPAFGGESVGYILNGANTAYSDLEFRQFFVDEQGNSSQGTITLTTGAKFRSEDVGGELDPENDRVMASFEAGYSGTVADRDTKLRDIDKFWTDEGEYILDQPRELTLTQGDGTQAKVMIYGEDTIGDLASKLNDAIANGLGQQKYVDGVGEFVSFVDGATQALEAVQGTMVIRSVLAGTKGEITPQHNSRICRDKVRCYCA